MNYDESKYLKDLLSLTQSQVHDTFTSSPQDFFALNKEHLTSREILAVASKLLIYSTNSVHNQMDIFDLTVDIRQLIKDFQVAFTDWVLKYEFEPRDKEKVTLLTKVLEDMVVRIQKKTG